MLTSDLILDVRDQLDQPDSTYLTDAMILRWLNEAQRQIARKVKCLKKTSDITTVADQGTYGDAFLDDVVEIDTVIYDIASTGTYLREITWTEAGMFGITNTSTGTPEVWIHNDDVDDHQISFYPIPAEDGKLISVIHWCLPTALTNGVTEEPEVPEDMQGAMVVFAQYKYKWMEGEYAEAKIIKDVFDEMVKGSRDEEFTNYSDAQTINVEAW